MGQPIDNVMNKVFTGVFHDFYDQYMLAVQFIPSGHPKLSTRQIIVIWVLKDWDMVLAELVRKSWTACSYHPEVIIGTTNKTTIVPYSTKQTSTLV